MAWAVIQSCGATVANTSASVTATFTTQNVVAGNKFVCVVACNNAAVTVKDGAGNSLTQLATHTQGTVILYLFGLDIPSGDGGTKPSIIATGSGTMFASIVVQEVSGLLAGNTTAMIDGTAGSSGGSAATTTSPTYSSTAANEYLVSPFGDFGGSFTWTVSGYTNDPNNQHNNNNDCGIAFKNSTGGAESAVYAVSGTVTYSQMLVAFKLAATAAAAPAVRAQPGPAHLRRYHHGKFPRPTIQPYVSFTTSQQLFETLTAAVAIAAANQSRIDANNLNATTAVTGSSQRKLDKTVAATMAVLASVAQLTRRSLTLVAIAVVTSAVSRKVSRFLVASAAAAVNVLRQVTRILAAPVTATASLVIQRFKNLLLIAAAACSTVAVRQVNRPIAGQTTISSANARALRKIMTAAVASTGTLTRNATRTIGATVVGVVSVVRTAGRSLSVQVAVSAAQARNAGRILPVQTTVQGSIPKRSLTRTLAAQLVVAATSVTSRLAFLVLAAVTAITGSVSRQINRPLSSGTTATGRTTRSAGRNLVPIVGITGTAARSLAKAITATVTAAATQLFIKAKQLLLAAQVTVQAASNSRIGRTLITPLIGTAAVSKSTGKIFAATATLTGSFTKAISKQIAATITASASVLSQKAKQLLFAAQVAMQAAASRKVSRQLAGFIVATASVPKSAGRILSAGVAATGSFTKIIGKFVAATVTAIASEVASGVRLVVLSAAVAVSSSARRSAAKLIVTLLIFTPSSVKISVGKLCTGGIAATGSLTRRVGRGLSVMVTAIPIMNTAKVRLLTLIANVVSAIQVNRGTSLHVNAPVALQSGFIRAITRTIQGNLTVAGQTVRAAARGISTGIVTSVSVLKSTNRIFAAAAALPASIGRQCRKIIPASVSLPAKLIQRINFHIAAASIARATELSGHIFLVALSTAFSVSVSVVARIFQSSTNIAIRLGTPALTWVTSTVKKNWRTGP